MATLSCSSYFLHPLSSSSSTSLTLPQQQQQKQQQQHPPLPTRPEIPSVLFRCSASIKPLQVIIEPTRLFVQPILLLTTGFNTPLDTQTFLATISVLAAIALSLFLGLKVTTTTCFCFFCIKWSLCLGNGFSWIFCRGTLCLARGVLAMVTTFSSSFYFSSFLVLELKKCRITMNNLVLCNPVTVD